MGLVACINNNSNPVLNIEGGQVKGVETDTSGITACKGIPFAAPVGDLVWISIGGEEPERMYQNVNTFHKRLEEGGIEHDYYESPGTSHEWQTWRRSLYRFAPKLF